MRQCGMFEKYQDPEEESYFERVLEKYEVDQVQHQLRLAKPEMCVGRFHSVDYAFFYLDLLS